MFGEAIRSDHSGNAESEHHRQRSKPPNGDGPPLEQRRVRVQRAVETLLHGLGRRLSGRGA